MMFHPLRRFDNRHDGEGHRGHEEPVGDAEAERAEWSEHVLELGGERLPGGCPLERMQFIGSVSIETKSRFVSGQTIGRGIKSFENRINRLRVPHETGRHRAEASLAIVANAFTVNAVRDGITRHRALFPLPFRARAAAVQ